MSTLDTQFQLSSEVIDGYTRNGYALLRGVFGQDELAPYSAEITRLTLALSNQDKPLAERDTYGKAFLQVMNLWCQSDLVRKFVFSKRLARIAAELMGVEGVRIYHDQSLYKEPSGGITPTHADQYYWPLASDKTITAWIPLQPVPVEMGPLAFYRGSHLSAFGRDLPISDESENLITRAMESGDFPLDEAAFEMGDVSFHAGWTFHRAGANQSDRPRSVMTIIYMDAEMKVANLTNAMQRADLAQWLPGTNPGELAASKLNPVVYSGSN